MYPHERSLVKKLQGKPFVLLGVNSDEDRQKLKKVIEKEHITWRSWWDGGGGPIETAYNIGHHPTIYVLDASGVIRYTDIGGKALEDAVEKLLEETEKKR